jgi:hypothetical protein
MQNNFNIFMYICWYHDCIYSSLLVTRQYNMQLTDRYKMKYENEREITQKITKNSQHIAVNFSILSTITVR